MRIPQLHWSIVVVLAVAFSVVGVLAAIGKIDAVRVIDIVAVVVAWLARSPVSLPEVKS